MTRKQGEAFIRKINDLEKENAKYLAALKDIIDYPYGYSQEDAVRQEYSTHLVQIAKEALKQQ